MPRQGSRKKKKTSFFAEYWPFILGAVLTPFAVKTAEILPLTGPDGLLRLKLMYPFPLLIQRPELGLSEANAERLSQVLLYAQFVLYGLYLSLALHWTTRARALLHVVLSHAGAFAVLWMLSR